jgi:hypothetical protein
MICLVIKSSVTSAVRNANRKRENLRRWVTQKWRALT